MIGFLTIVILAQQKITITRFFLQTQLPFYLFPVLFLFTIETLQKKVSPVWLLLFIPAFISTICIATDLYFVHDYNTPILLNGVYNNPPFFYHLLYKGNQVFFVIVLIWLIKRLNAYKSEIKNNFSFTDPIELSWLTNASWTFLIMTCISILTFLLSNFKILPIDAQDSFSIVSAFMALAIFYLSFHGIRQYSIAEYYGNRYLAPSEETTVPATEAIPDSKEKYKTSSLSEQEQESIYSLLLKLFEKDSVYQESKLQLQDVADMLQVPPHSLSQTINTMAGKPFYDFVNSYRVKYLQKLLEDPAQKRFTILALGVESGFNSKASLNRVFKEHTGFSPSEYQKRHLRK